MFSHKVVVFLLYVSLVGLVGEPVHFEDLQGNKPEVGGKASAEPVHAAASEGVFFHLFWEVYAIAELAFMV